MRSARVGGRSLSAASLTWWPDVKRDRSTDWPDPSPRTGRALSTPDQIARLDYALRWFPRWLTHERAAVAGLVPDAGGIVWARAVGWTYTRISGYRREFWGSPGTKGGRSPVPGGNSPKTLKRLERQTLAYLAAQLNQTNEQVECATILPDARGAYTRRVHQHRTVAEGIQSAEIGPIGLDVPAPIQVRIARRR